VEAVIDIVHMIDSLGVMSDRRIEGVFFRLSPREKKILQKVASADKRRVSEWVRIVALERAEQELPKIVAEEKAKKAKEE
jgi:isopropylmalate/homocitrate/citramalate synthase